MGAFVPVLRPREIPRRGRGPFLVSGARGGKNEIIFPGDMRGGKNTSHGAKCRGPAFQRDPGTRAECANHCAPGQRPGAQGRGHLKGGRQSPL